jgi:thioester reductase-like protein
MARTILFTGFPGFIGRRLIARLLEDDREAEVICLVQAKFLDLARQDAARVVERLGLPASRLSCQSGDVTDARLALDPALYDELAERVTEVWHLAAVYDLAVAEELARQVNVEGTRHVLAFCHACRDFHRLVHYSTCYVAGDRVGLIREAELVMGQGFKNRYESTKFAAEVLVRLAMEQGLEAIIIRPAIVVGDSRTGETDKFDGPYLAFKMIDKLRGVPLNLPRLGPSDAEINLVPVDYLVDATVALAKKPEARGMTFQIVDPTPLKAAQIYDLSCKMVTGRHAASYSVPAALFDRALHVRALRDWLKVPPEVLPYFNHKAKFDCADTVRLLEGSGVRIPDITEYFPVLHRYWSEHKDEPGFEAKV